VTRRSVLLRAKADADLLDIFEYIAISSGDVGRAERFIARLRSKCDDLAALPGQLGRSREELAPGLCSTPWRDYLILFRYAEDRVEIVRILHGARDIPALMANEPES
jgi:toxin ParE1/3/4